MKKILFLSIVTLIVFIIYLSTVDRKVYYLSITSKTSSEYNNYLISNLRSKNVLEKSILNFNKDNYRVMDFINMVEYNEIVSINNKKQSIRNALIKADILVLEIGKQDIIEITSKKEIDDIIININKYFKMIRKYCKEDIYVIPVYTKKIDNELLKIFNNKLNVEANKYQIHYINSDEKNLINELKKNIENYLFY